MKHNKENIKSTNRNLDSILKQAAEEKVGFSQENAKSLISKHAALAAGTAGGGVAALWLSKFGAKALVSVAGLILAGSLFLVYQNQKTNTNSKSVVSDKEISVKEKFVKDQSEKKSNSISNSAYVLPSGSFERAVIKDNIKYKAYTDNDDNYKLSLNIINNNDIESNTIQSDNMINVSDIAINQDFDFSLQEQDLSDIDFKPTESTYDFVDISNDNPEELQTLLNAIYNNSYWFSLERGTTYTGRGFGILSGFKAGWTMNDRFSAGFYGYTLADGFKGSYISEENISYSGKRKTGAGGLFFEYTFKPEDLLHYGISTQFGLGTNSLQAGASKNPWNMYLEIMPGAFAELNLTSWFKLNAYAALRINASVHDNYDREVNSKLDMNMPSNFNIGLSAKIGFF